MKKILWFALVCVICLSDGGNAFAQWERINVPYGGTVNSFCASDSAIFAVIDYGFGKLFVSKDDGANWINLDSNIIRTVGANFYYHFTTIAYNTKRLFVGTDGGGVLLSTDYGNSWTIVNNGLTNHKVGVLSVIKDYIFAVTDTNVFRSSDNGKIWSSIWNGMINPPILYLAAKDNIVLACNSKGEYRSTNNGETWSLIPAIGFHTGTLLTDSSDFYVGSGSGISKSTDEGMTWTRVDASLPDNNLLPSFSVKSGEILLARNFNIYRSTNDGKDWTLLNTLIKGDSILMKCILRSS